jgi:hypothetical protein
VAAVDSRQAVKEKAWSRRGPTTPVRASRGKGRGMQRLPGLLLRHPLGREFAQPTVDQRQQPACRVRIALLEGVQQSGDARRQCYRRTASLWARQRVSRLKLRKTRSWTMLSCSCPRSHLLVSEEGYTRKSSTRSSDD